MAMTRRKVLLHLGASTALLGDRSSASAHGYKRGSVKIVHPWCPDAHVDGTKDVIVSMDIENTGKAADKLMRAECKVASSVELRDHNGVLVPSLLIPGNAKVTLTRKDAHIRLIALNKTLTAYDTLPVTLVFDHAGHMNIDVLVEEPIEAKP